MSTLTNTQIRNTYDALLKLADNGNLTTVLKEITDGLGNVTPLSISQIAIKSSVDIEASGFKTPTGTSSQFLKADGSIDSTIYTGDQDLSGYLLNTTDTLTGDLTVTGDTNIGTTDNIISKNGDDQLNMFGDSGIRMESGDGLVFMLSDVVEFTGTSTIGFGSTNLATFDAFNLTTGRSYTLPDEAGTIALTSSIPSGNQIIDWTGASAGTIHITNLPATAITSVQIASTQVAMLALTTQEGDVVVRSDENKTYMHNGGTAGTMADFTELATPTSDVTSVDGATGAVVLNHNTLAGFVSNEHIDWTADQGATNIHAGNYTDTTYTNVSEFTNDAGYTGDQDLSSYALSADYLPLIGGTLTGALTGTTATFAGNVELSGYLSVEGTTGNTGGATDRWIGGDGTAGTWFYNVPTGSSHLFAINNSNVLTLSGTASTFAGTVSASNLSGTNTGDQDLSGYLLNTTDTLTGDLTVTGSITAGGNSVINGGAGADVLKLNKSTGASLGLSGSTGTTNNVIISASNSTNPYLDIYTGGAKRLTIDNTGNVGIGTDSPSAKLEVDNPVGQFGILTSIGGVRRIGLYNHSSNGAEIYMYNSNATSVVNLIRTSGDSYFNGGNVGIGTDSPDTPIDVSSESSTIASFRATGGASNNKRLEIGTGGDRVILKSFTDTTDVGAEIAFSNGNSEAMRIDTSGNVGIGTASPDSLLNLEGAKNTSIITLGSTTNNSSWSVGDRVGGIDFYSGDGSGAGSGIKASISYEVEEGVTGSTNSMVFRASGTTSGTKNLERMRITSGGTVEMGTATNGYRLNVGVDTGSGSTYSIYATGRIFSGTSVHATTEVSTDGTMTATGTMTASNFILSSDKRLKNSIEEVNNNHIDVNWKTFEMNSEEGQSRYGVIAQELEEVHPEFVRTDEQGMKSVAYIDLLIAKIAELEARLDKANI